MGRGVLSASSRFHLGSHGQASAADALAPIASRPLVASAPCPRSFVVHWPSWLTTPQKYGTSSMMRICLEARMRRQASYVQASRGRMLRCMVAGRPSCLPMTASLIVMLHACLYEERARDLHGVPCVGAGRSLD